VEVRALVVAFICVLWTRVSDVGIAEHGLPSIAVPFALGLIGVLLLERVATGARLDVKTFDRLWPILPYVLVVVCSVAWASDSVASVYAIVELFKDVLIFCVLVELIDSVKTLRSCYLGLLLVSASLGAISIYQAKTQTFTSDYAGFAQASLRQIVGSEHLYRVAGPVGDPNYYALVLLVVVPLGLSLLRTTTNRIGQILIVSSVVLIGSGVVLTYSRGGMLVLALALGLSLVQLGARLPLMLLVPLGILIAPAPVWDRLGTLLDPLRDDSVELRVGAQQVAVQMFLDHPFGGVGIANYPVLYEEYSRDLGVAAVASQFYPHNLYLQVAAETGAAGLLTFLPVVIGAVFSLERARRGAHPGEWRDLAGGVEIALFCYLVASLTLHASYPRYLWILLALATAGRTIRCRTS
jgi:O-antigen ligase